MNYEKPEIVIVRDAVEAVQGAVKMGPNFDTRPSSAAYSADE